ncbi:MAG: hypothetical protein K6U12_08260 [Armatimonadetes bacterium]|nr:hypothetical protein [Armatimonadota bacterium]CUU34601.1 hypothetical protein DCOP10_10941 [Armatimonadetes bacterium DC]
MKKDLVILVADRDMEQTLLGLLSRPKALAIREISFDIFIHPEHDPGVFLQGADFLRSLADQYCFALAMLDREGCGQERRSPEELENDLQARLESAGWEGRCAVVVLNPELEAWVFSSSTHVAEVIASGDTELYERKVSATPKNSLGKPERPKELMESLLREKRIPRSSSLYR